jgi:hypothetical protein
MEYRPMCDTRGEHAAVRGYLDCAEWCGLLPQADGREGQEVLELCVRPHWTDAAKVAARETVQAFVDLCVEAGLGSPYDDAAAEHYRIGMDLWLSRNRHGSGFFDGAYPEADKLQRIAHTFGECCVDVDETTEELTFTE